MADPNRPRRARRAEVGQTGARFGSPAVRRRLQAETAEAGYDAQPGPEPGPQDWADQDEPSLTSRPEVGQTGARFGSPAIRRRLQAQALGQEHPQQPAGAGAAAGGQLAAQAPDPRDAFAAGETMILPAGYLDAGPGPGRYEDADRYPYPAGEASGEAAWLDERDLDLEPGPARREAAHSLVRPYAWTAGRTEASYDLRLETLVSLTDHSSRVAAQAHTAEYRAIVALCSVPRSVAEVAAGLSVPLGVARVLLGDLIGMGVLAVHEAANRRGAGGPDQALLERVLAGLRRL